MLISRTVLALLALLMVPCGATFAQDLKVLVTVNDRPITSFDVDQRINLWKLLGRQNEGPGIRKLALNNLIDDIAKIEEAKKAGADASEKDIEERLANVAKGLKTDAKGLQGKLREQGVSLAAMRIYVSGQIAFSRLLRGKFRETITVTPAEVDLKLANYKSEISGRLAKIKTDPRMQPVTVYQLLEVSFPIDGGPDEITDQVLQSRFVEAAQYVSRFKGCKSARTAAAGIFNVKIGKTQDADGRKIPAQMRTAFTKKGAGSAIGPFRTKQGIQVWGFCGTRRISPQMPKVEYPTREQVETSIANEKYAKVEEKYSRILRKNILIEYRDPAYAE